VVFSVVSESDEQAAKPHPRLIRIEDTFGPKVDEGWFLNDKNEGRGCDFRWVTDEEDLQNPVSSHSSWFPAWFAGIEIDEARVNESKVLCWLCLEVARFYRVVL
jgi:hypothetical protein